MGRPELATASASILRPRSTLVPSRRTTTGMVTPTSFTASMTPWAMTSQRMMPPKMLISTAFTFGLPSRISKA